MKFRKFTAAAAASILALTPAFGINAYAAATEPNPVFGDFNENDVNGSIIITIDENTAADVKVNAETPEGTFDYYKDTYNAADGSVYTLKIEGNDDRKYNVEISVTDTDTKLSSKKYTESLTFADKDFSPNSWVNYNYILKKVEKDSETPYETKVTEKTVNGVKTIETEITFYVKQGFTKGDVNEDGSINALDASQVLTEYASVATGKASVLSDRQKSAADVNEDGSINALDASSILTYYAATAIGKEPTWK